MQNPFRNRDHDYRPESQDDRWEARDQSRDEGSSWSNGDGRVADRFRGQAQGYDAPEWRGQSDRAQFDQSQSDRFQYDRSQSDRSLSGSRGWGYGQDQQSRYGQGYATGYTGDRGPGGPSYGASGYGQGRGFDERSGSSYSGDYGRSSQPQGGGDYGRRDLYQRDQGYSQRHAQTRYPEHAYAPGSQIWDGQSQNYDHHSQASDFEPDYLHWRNQQLSNFDRDYSEWRTERRQKFSSDFDTWRQGRPRTEASGETRNPADNPVVGDISDGGTGDVKKR